MTAERLRQSPIVEVAPRIEVEVRDGYSERQIIEKYERLHAGLHDEEDPITWRTTLINVKFLLGVEDPIWDPLPEDKIEQAALMLQNLTAGSFQEPLIPEMLLAMGVSEQSLREHLRWEEQLDALVINGRHLGTDKEGHKFEPEPALFKTAHEINRRGKNVAFYNPVGRFGDNSDRVVSPPVLLHSPERIVIIGSTQEMGSLQALKDVLISLASPDFLGKTKNLDIVIPMSGGSRADKPGQPLSMGKESLSAKENARRLSQEALAVLDELRQAGLNEQNLPKIRFYSVDIHEPTLPESEFNKWGFEFSSICPEKLYANRICSELSNIDAQRRNKPRLTDMPMKVINFDKGATMRTQRFVEALLTNPDGCWDYIDVISVKKTRVDAGEVREAEVTQIDRWSVENGQLVITELWSLDNGMNHGYNGHDVPTMQNPSYEPCLIASDDDIIDTALTTEKNRKATELLWRHPDNFRITSYTHVVASKGVPLALERDDADLTLAGLTLSPKGLREAPRVRSIDLSKAIVDELFSNS
jgi:hypothetical protein